MTTEQIKKLSDFEIIKRFNETNEDKYYQILYDRYSEKIYRRCISLLKEKDDALDASQDIFVKLFTNISKFQEKSQFSTWVYSITYNYCIDMIRKRKKHSNVFSPEKDIPDNVIEEIDDKALLSIKVDRLKVILEEIPASDKAILLMKYQQDFSIRDIAEVLNKSESAVKMKIKRAKHKAQKAYVSIYGKNLND